jgi:tRNA threonylcarbamoyladenosine biosynthesis protein TsaE
MSEERAAEGAERIAWLTAGEGETEAVGEELVARLGGDAIVLLDGEMGSGKTVLVRGIARALGVDRREVQSPTYALIHEHDGERGHLVHVDLYRLEPPQVAGLGLDELLAAPGIKAVEWPDRFEEAPAGAWRVTLRLEPDGRRRIALSAADV